MNQSHLTYLSSPAWAQALRTDVLPWLSEAADLGDDVLEIGPGPGLTTDLLLELTAAGTVTAVEIDPGLAAELRARLGARLGDGLCDGSVGDGRVAVIHGDALAVPLEPGRFTAATCFSMLHHMPSPEAQDRLFARLHEVLRSGAALLGVDTVDSDFIRDAHVDDTYVPVDPDTLPARLGAAGFTGISVTRPNDQQFRFVARKP